MYVPVFSTGIISGKLNMYIRMYAHTYMHMYIVICIHIHAMHHKLLTVSVLGTSMICTEHGS